MGRLVDSDDVIKRLKEAMPKLEKDHPEGLFFKAPVLIYLVEKLLEATPKPRIKQRKCNMR